MKKNKLYSVIALLLLGCMLFSAAASAAAYEPSISLTDVTGISRTSAQLNAFVSCAVMQRYDSVGFYLSSDKNGIDQNRYSMSYAPKTASFMLSVSASKLRNMYGLLKPGSIYYYKMFVVAGGEEYCSSVGWFRTTDESGDTNKGKPTFLLYDAGEITMDSAALRCDVTANPMNLSFTKVGLLMGTAKNAMNEFMSVKPNSASFPRLICQTAQYKRLTPLTTYYYQFYVQTKAGASYASEIKSFTTLAPYHTVSFQPNGGYLSQMNAITVYPGQPYSFFETPMRPGFVFAGWFTLPVGGQLVQSSGVWNYDADVTLYAQWLQNTGAQTVPAGAGQLQVLFDLNHDNLGATESKVVEYGGKYGTLPEPKREGYKLSGWYTAQENGVHIKSSTKVEGAGTQVLYAVWTPRSYELRLRGNGGSVSPDKMNMQYGEIYTLPAALRDGYIFTGWNTAKDGSGTTIVGGAPWSYTKKLTLYAQWSKTSSVPVGGLPAGTVPVG